MEKQEFCSFQMNSYDIISQLSSTCSVLEKLAVTNEEFREFIEAAEEFLQDIKFIIEPHYRKTAGPNNIDAPLRSIARDEVFGKNITIR